MKIYLSNRESKNLVIRTEGYYDLGHWNSSSKLWIINPDSPYFNMPKINELTSEQAIIISRRLKFIERHPSTEISSYKGSSTSRITGEELGSNEYKAYSSDHTLCYIWPEDFNEHYILTHKVKPHDNFLKFIGIELSDNTAKINQSDDPVRFMKY